MTPAPRTAASSAASAVLTEKRERIGTDLYQLPLIRTCAPIGEVRWTVADTDIDFPVVRAAEAARTTGWGGG